MVREFYILLALLLISLTVISTHSLYTRSKSHDKSLIITRLTNISAPSLSVAYYEPRVLYSEQASNPAYPQMQSIERMSFVYAK